MEKSPGTTVNRDLDGLFRIAMKINGKKLTCLIDTGASSITLSSKQADKLGVLISAWAGGGKLRTAAGTLPAKRVDLKSVELSDHRFENVTAVIVSHVELPCLLGTDVLNRVEGIEIQGSHLKLR